MRDSKLLGFSNLLNLASVEGASQHYPFTQRRGAKESGMYPKEKRLYEQAERGGKRAEEKEEARKRSQLSDIGRHRDGYE